MAIINLRDYYPFYTSDYFMEVPEDVVECSRSLTGRKPLTAAYIPAQSLLLPGSE